MAPQLLKGFHIYTWQAFVSVEAETDVFNKHGTSIDPRGSACLFTGDSFGVSLQLREIHAHVGNGVVSYCMQEFS